MSNLRAKLKFNETDNYPREKIRRVQMHLMDTAIEIREVLEKYGVKYFLGYGSLLGSLRLKGFFPWDDDIDFCILDEDYDFAIKCLSEELSSQHLLHNEMNDPLYFHSWSRVRNKRVRVVPDTSIGNVDNYFYDYPYVSIDLYKIHMLQSNDPSEFLFKEHMQFIQRKLDRELLSRDEFRELEKKIIDVSNKRKPTVHMNGKYIMHEVKMRSPIPYSKIFPFKETSFENQEFKAPREPEFYLTEIYGDYKRLPPMAKRKPHYLNASLFR